MTLIKISTGVFVILSIFFNSAVAKNRAEIKMPTYIVSRRYKPPPCVVHYEEMGCNPMKKKGSNEIYAYNCKNIFNALENGMCVAYGNSYYLGAILDDTNLLPKCSGGCFCANEFLTLNRTQMLCPYVMDCARPPELIEGCHYEQSLTRCCNFEQLCPELMDLATCNVSGTTYYEGQYFVPPDAPCMECVCQEDFKGRYVMPFCQRRKCGIPFSYQSISFQDFCAPVYYIQDNCCPADWKCKTPKEHNDLGKKYNGHLPRGSCRFGDRVMPIGTNFLVKNQTENDYAVNCTCKVPPLATCTL